MTTTRAPERPDLGDRPSVPAFDRPAAPRAESRSRRRLPSRTPRAVKDLAVPTDDRLRSLVAVLGSPQVAGNAPPASEFAVACQAAARKASSPTVGGPPHRVALEVDVERGALTGAVVAELEANAPQVVFEVAIDDRDVVVVRVTEYVVRRVRILGIVPLGRARVAGGDRYVRFVEALRAELT